MILNYYFKCSSLMINYACQFLNCENTLAVSALISGAVVTETAKSFLTSIPDEEGTYWRIILSANRPEYKTLIYKQTRVDPVSSKTAYDCFSVCKNFWKVTGGGEQRRTTRSWESSFTDHVYAEWKKTKRNFHYILCVWVDVSTRNGSKPATAITMLLLFI